MSATHSYRTLVIDDDACVHELFANLLSRDLIRSACSQPAAAFPAAQPFPLFEVDSAFCGQQGLEFVQKALEEKRPYTMAFVDMRMKSGWNGIETIGHIWRTYPELQVVICTAYSDYSWGEIIKTLGAADDG